jgi:hypothetical protein
LATVLNLCIGVSRLEFRHGDAIGNIKEDGDRSRKSASGRLFRPC